MGGPTILVTTDTCASDVSLPCINNLAVPVSAFTATDNVAVIGYLITTSATAPAASATGWTATTPTSVTAVAGSNNFYAWAKDAAGNVSASRSATVVVTIPTVDTTPPTLIVSTLANGSFTNKVTLNVSGSATDAGGLKSVTVNGQIVVVNADGSFSAALTLAVGANTITVIATDLAGNQTTNSRTITYDPTAPVLTITAPADNSTTVQSFVTVSGMVNENSTVTVSVNGGSPQSAAMTGTSFIATVNLVSVINTIDITATDLAGNTTSAKRTITYSAPASQLTLAVTNPPQDVTTRNDTMTIRGTVTDASGTVRVVIKVNNHSDTVHVSHDGDFSTEVSFSRAGTYVITVTATDSSGNTATVTRNVIYRPQHDNHDD
jgi:hypothetical protein